MKKLIALLLAVVLICGLFGCGKQTEAEPDDAAEDPADETPKSDVALLQEKVGGYLYGISSPGENYMRLKDVGFGWVRVAVPYPYDASGNLRDEYGGFKYGLQQYVNKGLKIMAITPVPKDFVNIGGFDPVASENLARTKQVASFLATDLQGLVSAFQISNEMGHPLFTAPLTSLDQGAKFIGIQAQAMNDVKGNIIVGYNSAGLAKELHTRMKSYLKYMDWVGIDIYYGTWSAGGLDNYVTDINALYKLVKKPFLLAEFGYASKGTPKSDEERAAILAEYGYASEAEARADIENMVAKLPNVLRTRIEQGYPDHADWGDALFGYYGDHFYGYQNLSVTGMPHDNEGQAAFYRELIPLLKQQEHLAGFFIYCWQDATTCSTCGLERCPYETAWGLVDVNDHKKPSYSAVKEAIAAAKEADQ